MTTAVDLSSSATPSEPDRRAVAAAGGPRVAESAAGFVYEVHVRDQVLVRPTPFSVAREADGTVLVSDHHDQVVGTGGSLLEALEDFRAALRQHVNYLRANRGRLHQRLAEELKRLEHDFPWV